MTSKHEASDDQRLINLGLLTVRSAKLEEDLRDAFCNLVGSKYAAVVAGGQAASWLIDQCQALLKANLEIADSHKQAMREALEQSKIATEQRNTLIHGVKFSLLPGADVVTHRSRRGTFEPTTEYWSDDAIRGVVSRISAARSALNDAVGDAFRNGVFVTHTLALETRALHR
jgi:hypothetical protein